MPQPRLLLRAPALLLLALALAGGLAPGPAQAQAIFSGSLDGASVNPPNASPGSGTAAVTADEDELVVDLSFSGLIGVSTASHLHCCATPPANVGVAILFPGFPTGVTSGVYGNTFDLANNATYVTAFFNASGGTAATARAALLTAMEQGRAYTCVHTNVFPGGEIRSFLAFDLFADGFESMDLLDWSSTAP